MGCVDVTDISACNDHACPSKKTCYRYMCEKDTHRQSYALFYRLEDEDKCEHYWNIQEC